MAKVDQKYVAHLHFWQTSDFLAAIAIVLGFALERIYPTSLYLSFHIVLGVLLWIAGLIIIFTAKSQFKKQQQKTGPGAETTALIQSGLYARSRNPIYVGMLVIVIGFAFLFDSVWLFGSALLTSSLFHFILIAPEEKYLQEKFPEEFTQYKESVRRWM